MTVRHPYSTNSDERKIVPGVLAILALFTSFALTALFDLIHWTPPPQVDVTSVLVLYGLYYWLFKKFCWKWEWLSSVGNPMNIGDIEAYSLSRLVETACETAKVLAHVKSILKDIGLK